MEADYARFNIFTEVASDCFANHRFQFIKGIRFRENGMPKRACFVTTLRGLKDREDNFAIRHSTLLQDIIG